MNQRLLELLERGELDWDDLRHREMYLRTWVKTGSGPFVRSKA